MLRYHFFAIRNFNTSALCSCDKIAPRVIRQWKSENYLIIIIANPQKKTLLTPRVFRRCLRLKNQLPTLEELRISFLNV